MAPPAASPAVLPRGRRSPAPMRALVPQPAALTRLVCFPHSGAGPSVFQRWGTGLAPDIEVWPVTLPGRGSRSREPFARAWAPLVAEMASAVLDGGTGPVALFGHSMGALLAFEVARALTRAGSPPLHLVVSGRAAPTGAARRPDLPADDLALIDAVDRIYQGVPAAVRESPELIAHFAPVLRADLELVASHSYVPGPALTCPVTAMGGVDDPTVTEEELQGWAEHTRGGFARTMFPGGHFYLGEAERPVLDVLWSRLTAPPLVQTHP
ncbi:Thioesterase PikA5 [Nocardiopsis dassonvillei]|uniref:thioesterase II family protein n=1 Tax=Nocardiopsis dassonvillei TaxID=2014 RepID=UPI003F56CFF2